MSRILCQITSDAQLSSCDERLVDAREVSVLEGRCLVSALKSSGAADEEQSPFMEHRHAIADLLNVGERVRREEHGLPVRAQVPQRRLQQRSSFGVETARRFVQHL